MCSPPPPPPPPHDGSDTKKNSPARNLHRLLNNLNFISAIFENLAKGQTLKDAVSDAYDRTLAHIHAWVVRAGIKTGMMALPTREHFLASIGETGARLRQVAGTPGGGGGSSGAGVLACTGGGLVRLRSGRQGGAVGPSGRRVRLCCGCLHASVPAISHQRTMTDVVLPAHLPAAPACRRAEDSARKHAEGFVEAAHQLVGTVEKLYAGIEIPRSDFSVSSLWK